MKRGALRAEPGWQPGLPAGVGVRDQFVQVDLRFDPALDPVTFFGNERRLIDVNQRGRRREIEAGFGLQRQLGQLGQDGSVTVKAVLLSRSSGRNRNVPASGEATNYLPAISPPAMWARPSTGAIQPSGTCFTLSCPHG